MSSAQVAESAGGGPKWSAVPLIEGVRRPVPRNCHVLDGSTPVVAFGDSDVAEVSTLGINPSPAEFLDGGRWLSGDQRRLATLESLHTDSTESLTYEQVQQMVGECAEDFHRHPNSRWFNPLNHILYPTGDPRTPGSAGLARPSPRGWARDH